MAGLSSAALCKVVSPSFTYIPPGLAYNTTTYYWRVRVWDTGGEVSEWTTTSYAGSSFATAAHRYPYVRFSQIPDFPNTPKLGEDIRLCSVATGDCLSATPVSTCYDIISTGDSCENRTFLWTLSGADFVTGSSASSSDPIVQATSAGSQATLTITDNTLYACPFGPKNLNTVLPLPKWKEISPSF